MSDLLIQLTSDLGSVLGPSLPGDAGFNTTCVEDAQVLPGMITKIDLGFKMALPEGIVCTMIGRSSAVSRGLFVLPCLIDEGYRGPMFAFVTNLTGTIIEVKAGEQIAQLVLLPNLARDVEVQWVGDLPESVRGENGFGSTGVKAPVSRETKVPGQNMFKVANALADVCQMSFEMNKGQLLGEAKLLNKDPELIRALFGKGGPWYRFDFRGKQGQPPLPSQVRQCWTRMHAQHVASRVTKTFEDGSASV
jgi:dUTP pyrophosphatase